MGEKTYTSIYIDKEVLEKAREIGLNVSKTCENALKEAIRRLEGSNNPNKGGIGTVGSNWWTGRDSDPRPPPLSVLAYVRRRREH